MWDLTAVDQAPTFLTGHVDHVLSLAWSPIGQLLAFSSDDGTSRIWDLATPNAQPREIGPGGLDRMIFSPDGGTLAGYQDGGKQICLWDVGQIETLPVEIHIDQEKVDSLCFSPDGEIMAVGLDNGTVRLWNVRQPKSPPRTLFGCRSAVRALFFSHDGIMLSACEEYGIVQRWWLTGSWLAEQVCKLVGRNLTYDEWQRLVGEAIPYERTCPNLPTHPSVLEAGDRLASALDYEGAVAIFRRALDLDPQIELIPELRAHEAVARAHFDTGDLPGFLADLEQARAAAPGMTPRRHVELLVASALIWALYGRVDEAFAIFRAAQQLIAPAPLQASRWLQLYLQQSASGQAVDAAEAIEHAIGQTPDDGTMYAAYGARAVTGSIFGNISGAIEDLKHYVEWAHSRDDNADVIVEVDGWIAALRAGRNLFLGDDARPAQPSAGQ